MYTLDPSTGNRARRFPERAHTQMKYVFVCGLHRSGTTILARHVGQLQNCTAFYNTGKIMDEGQHLQDVYPPDYIYGGVGKFGFAPQAHLTESSPLLTPENVFRLLRTWENFWDPHKTIRVEKTPGNLLITRFLQAAFPNSYFIVIKRHPVPVSLASQKWSLSSLHHLFEHWLHCHEIFLADRKYLRHVYEVSYEEYIQNPMLHLMHIGSFLDTEVSHPLIIESTDIHNSKYFAVWARMLERSPFRSYYRAVVRKYEERFAAHGYSIVPTGIGEALSVNKGNMIAESLSPLLYAGADLYCDLWEMKCRLRRLARQTARHYCPDKVQTFLRNYKAQQARRCT